MEYSYYKIIELYIRWKLIIHRFLKWCSISLKLFVTRYQRIMCNTRCAKLRSIWESISCCELLQFSKFHSYEVQAWLFGMSIQRFNVIKIAAAVGLQISCTFWCEHFLQQFPLANIKTLYCNPIQHEEKKALQFPAQHNRNSTRYPFSTANVLFHFMIYGTRIQRFIFRYRNKSVEENTPTKRYMKFEAPMQPQKFLL